MNREKIKSIILLFLVALSFILTTRIWFNVSIEGIFVMFQSKGKIAAGEVSIYDKSNLMKPSKLIVNFGEHHTLLTDNQANDKMYKDILDSSRNTLKTLFYAVQKGSAKVYSSDRLGQIRAQKNVELKFGFTMDAKTFANLLGVDKDIAEDIKHINTAIIAPMSSSVYLIDEGEKLIYEFSNIEAQGNMAHMISEIEKQSSLSYIFFNELQPELYSSNVIVPVVVESSSLPELSAEREDFSEANSRNTIAMFFKDDISTISVIKDPDGTQVYTDRQEMGVRLDPKGTLEYVRYSVTIPDIGSEQPKLQEALDISTDFINKHMGFPYDCYISRIETTVAEGRTIGYVIKYNYSYEGMPVLIYTGEANNDAIEIEIIGKEVKRYKRNVRLIGNPKEAKTLKSPVEMLDILASKKITDFNGDSIVKIDDMYLAYFESELQGKTSFIPVWVVYAQVEKPEGEGEKKEIKQYIINAESGAILEKK